MKKIISIAVCFFILLSCVLPVQASGGVPEKVMESTKSVVRILSKYYSSAATGSGFVIKNEPGEVLIATNDHVVSGNPYSISVWVGENELVDAEIVFTTSAKDLCVLRVTAPVDMKPLTLSTEDPQHGAAIYVVGYPGAGDILSDTQAHTSDSVTITDGIISAIRTFTIESGADPVKLLQVNAAINSGNSGGPLFNTDGVVIGVNTYKVNANSQGVFGSVDISELWGLLEQHGIEIPMQQEVVEEEISEEKVIPVSVIAIAVGTVVTLIVIFVLIKVKKKKTKTLRKYMEAHPNGLGVSEAVSMLLPVAIQLRVLHNNGKLHLQVSPDSILISASSAALKESSQKETDRHAVGFAAPEIYKGVGLGMASDLYSFAAVLYYVATGKIPVNSLQYELLETELAILEETEPIFTEIIRKGMAHLPQDRIQSMQELIYGVSAFSTQKLHVPESKKTVVPQQKKEKIKKQKKPVKALPFVTATILCAVVVVLLWKPFIQPQIDAKNEAARLEAAYHAAVSLMEEGRYEEAIEAFTLLVGYQDSEEQIKNCRIAIENAVLEKKYQEAEALAAEGKHAHAGIAFGRLGDYKDAQKRSFALWEQITVENTLFAGMYHTVGLTSCGIVVAVGAYSSGRRNVNVSGWQDIVGISAGHEHTVGLKSNGTVVAEGDNFCGQCDVSDWQNIVGISAKWQHTVGLKPDGTVVAVGNNMFNQCDVSHWRNIVAVSAGWEHTVGLKSDGTVMTTGVLQDELLDWFDIIAISAGTDFTVGLKADGTVVAEGANFYGQCDVSDWQNIVGISAGHEHTVGLRSDGTVIAVGANSYSQCNVSDWYDIVAVSAGGDHTVGLKSDGTVVYAGRGQRAMPDWTDIKLPS